MTEVETLTHWLKVHEEQPKLHINGPEYNTAIMTVDFGQPLRELKITTDDEIALSKLMKDAAKSIRHRGNFRINKDSHHGMFWVSIS